MGFDTQRAVVAAGDGVVARFPGILCVAQGSDPDGVRRLLELCASVAGTDPGRALARRLVAWMCGPEAPDDDLRFGTLAAAGNQVAVFLVGEVEAWVEGSDRPVLSGADAAIGTDRLLPRPDAPVIVALGEIRRPADPADVLDLREGVVVGTGAVLHPATPAGPSGLFDDADPERDGEEADEGRHDWFADARSRAADRPTRVPSAANGTEASDDVFAAHDTDDAHDTYYAHDTDAHDTDAHGAAGNGQDSRLWDTGAWPVRLFGDADSGDSVHSADPPPGGEALDDGDRRGPTAWPWPADGGGRDVFGTVRPGPAPLPASGRHAVDPPLPTRVSRRDPVPPDPAATNGHATPDDDSGAETDLASRPSLRLHEGGAVEGGAVERGAVEDGAVQGRVVDGGADQRGAPEEDTAAPFEVADDADPVRTPPGGVVTNPEGEPAADPEPVFAEPASADQAASENEADEAEGAGPQVRGYVCDKGHLNDPRAPYCGRCGAKIDERAAGLVDGPRPALGRLVFDDGATYTVDEGYLVGRMPESDDRVQAGGLRPIVVEDRSGSVSRVHAEIQVTGWDVLLLDAGSRNGTFVAGPEESGWSPLAPQRSRRLLPGTRVRLGSRTFVFESASGVR